MESTVEELNEIRKKMFRKNMIVATVTTIVLILALILSLSVGPVKLSLADVFASLIGKGSENYIIQNVRLPRILCCVLVGAALSVSGLAMQGLFRNPMASPSVIGVSSGAAFGASLAMGFGVGLTFGMYAVPAMSFVFCFGTMFLVYILARTSGGTSVTMLLLAGIAVGAFFNGMVSVVQYIVDESTLPGIVYWLMGNVADCRWPEFRLALIPVIAGMIIIWMRAKELNLISLGEEQAENLGVNVDQTRILLLIGSSLAVAGAVSISGIIGFVGLIIPHVFRMIVGPDHKVLVPLSIVGGAAFLIIMDVVSRSIMSPVELPIGILTALLGAPFFIYIMRTKRKFMMGGD
ncbi:MAG: iron ABC transporter permease [Methanomassiliicoccaceae archaeon]|nr:iron ABC transporter permease [Methanomassiliicoccaceae archaeon]